MNKIYRNILATASALMAPALTGCVNEDSPCPDNDDPGQGMSIQFTVVTHNPGQGAGAQSQTDAPSGAPALNGASRADDCNGEQTGSPAENFIDMSTCQFFLFDGTGTVLRRIFPEETSKNETSYQWYQFKAEIVEPYFDNAIKSGQPTVDFYIMVIANSKSLDGQEIAYTPGRTTIADIINQGRTFRRPPEGFYNDTGFHGWAPSLNISDNRMIPMTGIQKFTVSTADLATSTYDTPVSLSPGMTGGIPVQTPKDIDMLRALAKIEVIDKIDLPDGYDPTIDRIEIEKVELVGLYNTGRLLPDWPDYVTEQVTTPTLPAANQYLEPLAYSEQYTVNNGDKIVFFDLDPYSSEHFHQNYPVFSGYTTEYSLNSIGNKVKPYIVVTLVNKNDNTQTSYYKELKLSKYEDGKPNGDGIEFMLRNHIYRYVITGVESDTQLLQVGYSICDWSDYTVDIPSFN